METEGYEVPITEQALRTIKQYAKGYTVVPIPAREEEPYIGKVISLRDSKWYRDVVKAYLAIKTSSAYAIVKDNADGQTGTVVAVVRATK